MVDVAYSDTRDEVFDFNTIIVLSSWSQIYARRGVYLETILDLDQRRVSILASGIQQEVLRERIKAYGIQPELVPIDSYPGMFEQLETGEVDAAIVNNFFGNKFSPTIQSIKPIFCLIQPGYIMSFPKAIPSSSCLVLIGK